ncbi:hypothetical protein JHK82_055881 [Glycine max]|nr:hypothetical protein JHK82_055881 [Glycine max]
MQELAFDRLATNDAQDDDFLNSNDRVDLKIAPASDTGVSIGSHLKGAGVNYCGTEYDENCTYRSLTLSLQYFIECSMEDMMLLMIDGYSLESEPLPSSDLIETSRRRAPMAIFHGCHTTFNYHNPHHPPNHLSSLLPLHTTLHQKPPSFPF